MAKKKEESQDKELYGTKPVIKSTEINKIHEYEKIFNIVEHNKLFSIAVGNKIATANNFESLEEAQAYIDSKPWDLIINAACSVFEICNDLQRGAGVAAPRAGK